MPVRFKASQRIAGREYYCGSFYEGRGKCSARYKYTGTENWYCSKCISKPKKTKKAWHKDKKFSRGIHIRKIDQEPVVYADYMASDAWLNKRLAYWKSDRPKECYICGKPWVGFVGMELHHRTYERLGDENLDDLVPVCPEHHALITEAWKNKLYRGLTLWEVTDKVRARFTRMG